MTLSFKQWGMFIGLVMAVGMMKAVERNALWLKAHDVGRREARLHVLENETQRLQTDVSYLQSPSSLAKTMTQSHANFVAWSTFPSAAQRTRVAILPHRDE